MAAPAARLHHDRMLPARWSQPQSHRLRTGQSSLAGQAYLVTFTPLERRPLFREFEQARLTCQVLAAQSAWPHLDLLAWLLMPDHWHGLVQLGEESLSRGIARAKAASTRGWHLAYAGSGPLWAPGFHDHALRREESLLDCARYIVLNPVRAGLVNHCGLYPFWDAAWL